MEPRCVVVDESNLCHGGGRTGRLDPRWQSGAKPAGKQATGTKRVAAKRLVVVVVHSESERSCALCATGPSEWSAYWMDEQQQGAPLRLCVVGSLALLAVVVVDVVDVAHGHYHGHRETSMVRDLKFARPTLREPLF